MKIRIGAPAYHHMLRAEHAQMMMELAIFCGHDQAHVAANRAAGIGDRKDLEVEPWIIEAIHYTHCSLLPLGRERVLSAALESDADLLLSVDSDTWLEISVLVKWLEASADLLAAEGGDTIGCIGMCIPQDDGRVNAWRAAGERIDTPKLWEPVRVAAIGAAATIIPLAWHRRVAAANVKWPNVGYAVVPTGLPHGYIGEDFFFCDAINRLEGRVIAYHAGRGVRHGAFASGERPR